MFRPFAKIYIHINVTTQYEFWNHVHLFYGYSKTMRYIINSIVISAVIFIDR
jgi:hypothetical protein